ncbi:hypothetical protein V1506DRAFT_509112 [Lipomyces tetrasporus]
MAIGAALSTKWSLKASNVLGFFKVVTLLFISIYGLVVLGTRGKELPPTLRLSRMLLSKHPSVTEELNTCSTSWVNPKSTEDLPLLRSRDHCFDICPLHPGRHGFFTGEGNVEDITSGNNLAVGLFFENTSALRNQSKLWIQGPRLGRNTGSSFPACPK